MLKQSFNLDRLSHATLCLHALSIPLSTSLTTISILMILILGLLSRLAVRNNRPDFHPLFIGLFAFISYYFISILYSTAPSTDIKEGLSDFIRLLYLYPLLILCSRLKNTEMLWRCFIISMLLTCVIGFLKLYGGLSIGKSVYLANEIYHANASLFKSHITTNLFMAIAAFYCAHQARIYPTSKWKWVLLTILFLYYIFYMSWGRTGQLITVALMVLFVFQSVARWQYRVGLILVASLSIIFIFLTSDTLQFRVKQLQDDLTIFQKNENLVTSSLGSRLDFYLKSGSIIKDQLLLGSGLGSFKAEYQTKFPNGLKTDNPHNEYLLLLTEGGIIGLGLGVSVFILLVYYSSSLPLMQRHLAQGVLLALSIGCLANSWLHDAAESHFFIFSLACLYSHLPCFRNNSHGLA